MLSSVNIYVLCEPGTNTVRYIGKTKQSLDKRLKQHVLDSKLKLPTHKNCWIRALLNQGKLPDIKIIRIVNENTWQYYERFYIEYYTYLGYNLVNGTKGGEGTNGWVPSALTLQRMRESAKLRMKDCSGSKNNFFAHTHSTLTKLRISQSKKGQGLGHKHSEETKKKLSEKAFLREERKRSSNI